MAKGKGKVALLSLKDLDGRTQAARDAHLLYGEYQDYVNGAENGVDAREQAEAAALLAAMRKDKAARWFRGEPVGTAEICTLVNSEARVIANMREWRGHKDNTETIEGAVARLRLERARKDAEDAGNEPGGGE